MKKQDFEASPAGAVVKTEQNQWAFMPNPLPPENIDLTRLTPALEKASAKIGELNGISRTLQNPFLLIAPLQNKEALSSSSMEGTHSTVDDLMLAEAGVKVGDETREVANYRRALANACESFKKLPLSLRTLRGAHEILLSGVAPHRGANVVPGEFRRYQNFIGARKIEDARFIPPPPQHVAQMMSDLERFWHDDDRRRASDMIEAALIHYQFEAIHPFSDGNGRVGRMLITLHLLMRGVITSPVLYLSPTLEKRKNEYIDLMYKVSKDGAWNEWIMFFLQCAESAACSAIATADKLFSLQKEYRESLQRKGRSANLSRIADFLFERPIVSVPDVQQLLEVTYRAAQLNVQTLVEAEVLTEFPVHSNPKLFVAKGVLEIIAGHDS